MRRLLAAGLVGAALAALIFVGVLYVADLEVVESGGDPESVAVPAVLGESASDARATVEAVGLEARVVGQPTAYETTFEAETGATGVIEQTPSAGTEAPPDATVTLDMGG